MLWFLTTDKGEYFYLTGNEPYSIGRSGCNLNLPSDQSVSRKHASIYVLSDRVKIVDVGSRYGTYLNEAIATNDTATRIEQNMEVELKYGDRIRFGMQWNIWTLQCVNFVTVMSNVSAEGKDIVQTILTSLRGQVLRDWDESCTHITLEMVLLTAKMLCALTIGRPIVNIQYWRDCLQCVEENRPLPNPKSYLPPIQEDLIDKENVSLEYNPERKVLFKGKIFLFANDQAYQRLRVMVEIAGGRATTWKEFGFQGMEDPSVLVLRPSSEAPPVEHLDQVDAYLRNRGKRLISEHEIALAILHCDVSKHCNPYFDVTNAIFGQREQVNINQHVGVLAKGTQESHMADTQRSNISVSESFAIPSQDMIKTQEIDAGYNPNQSQDNVGLFASQTGIGKKRKSDFETDQPTQPFFDVQKTTSTSNENAFMLPAKKQRMYDLPDAENIEQIKNEMDDSLSNKRSAEEYLGSDPKRPHIDEYEAEINGLLNFKTENSTIMDASGWLSKTFLAMDIKKEDDEIFEGKPDYIIDYIKSIQSKIKVTAMPLVLSNRTPEHAMNNIAQNKSNFKKFRKNPTKLARSICTSYTRDVSKPQTQDEIDNNTEQNSESDLNFFEKFDLNMKTTPRLIT